MIEKQGPGVRDQGSGGRAGVPARRMRCTGWKACATSRKQKMWAGTARLFPLVPKLHLGTSLWPKLCLGKAKLCTQLGSQAQLGNQGID